MNTKTNLPTGGSVLLLLALAAAPVVIKKLKPVAKSLGEAMVKAGTSVKNAAG